MMTTLKARDRDGHVEDCAGVSCTADDKKELERLSKSLIDEAQMVHGGILATGGLQRYNMAYPTQQKASSGDSFMVKVTDVIGVPEPATSALVLSMSKEPSIQALERKTGFVFTSSGNIVGD